MNLNHLGKGIHKGPINAIIGPERLKIPQALPGTIIVPACYGEKNSLLISLRYR